MVQVDLNCDLGESFGNYKLGNDESILPLITSANVACGFHAGDQHVMNETVKMVGKPSMTVSSNVPFIFSIASSLSSPLTSILATNES